MVRLLRRQFISPYIPRLLGAKDDPDQDHWQEDLKGV